MSDDSTLDFFSEGAQGSQPTAGGDPTANYFSSGGPQLVGSKGAVPGAWKTEAGQADPVTQYVHSAVSGLAQNVGASTHLLHDWANGNIHSIADADQSVKDYKAQNPAYQPETEGGKTVAAAMGSPYNPVNWPGKVSEYAGKGLTATLDAAGVPSQYSTIAGPALEAGANVAMGTAGAVKGLGLGEGAGAPEGATAAAPRARIEPTLEPNEAPQVSASVGGAPATGAPTLSASGAPRQPYSSVGEQPSPEGAAGVQQQVQQQAKGSPVPIDPIAATRQAQADGLQFPVGMTKGQRTQDVNQITWEGNNRVGQIAAQMDADNKALGQNIVHYGKQAGGDTATLDNEAHSSALMDKYEVHDQAANAAISAKYQALKDANNGVFPIDQQKLLGNVDTALDKDLLTPETMSTALRGALGKFQEGAGPDGTTRTMTLPDFERIRTIAATDMRGGGQEAGAAHIVRQQVENLPLAPEAQGLVNLANDARGAAKARFDAIEADPAYKAVVNGTANSRTFANKYVINAPREGLEAIHGTFGADPEIQQHLGGVATNYLRDRARVDTNGTGNFAAASYNTGLKYLQNNGKLPLLIPDAPIRGKLNDLGDVSRYTTAQPRGSAVGPSTPGLIAAYGPGLAEQAASAVTHGVGGPIIRGVRTVSGYVSQKARVKDALDPTAGITPPRSLADLMRPPGDQAR
jgi:hypothetical protein